MLPNCFLDFIIGVLIFHLWIPRQRGHRRSNNFGLAEAYLFGIDTHVTGGGGLTLNLAQHRKVIFSADVFDSISKGKGTAKERVNFIGLV